ncbi:probable methyltransferase PMT26 [Tanacetum coccineum]
MGPHMEINLMQAVNKSQQRGASRYCAKNAHELLIKDSIPVVEDSITIRNNRRCEGSSARRLNIDGASQENNNYTYHDMQDVNKSQQRGATSSYGKNVCELMLKHSVPVGEDSIIIRNNRRHTLSEGRCIRCKMMASVVEVDRLLRPEGKLIVRDNNVENIYEVEKALRSMHWNLRLTYSKNMKGLLCNGKIVPVHGKVYTVVVIKIPRTKMLRSCRLRKTCGFDMALLWDG